MRLNASLTVPRVELSQVLNGDCHLMIGFIRKLLKDRRGNVLAIACGIPAALLFLWILARASGISMRAARRATVGTPEAAIARIVAALMPAIVLNTFFGLTFTLYSVAPIAWLLIGWISAEELRATIAAAESGATPAGVEI